MCSLCWQFGRRFPLASLALFSSKGRPVGGSTGGGVASRRKQINGQLRAAEQRQVRAYVEGVAEACGVTLPPSELEAEPVAESVAPKVVSAEDEWGGDSEDDAPAPIDNAKVGSGGDGTEPNADESDEDDEEDDDEDEEDAMMRRMVGATAKKKAAPPPPALPPPAPPPATVTIPPAAVASSDKDGSDDDSSCPDDALEGLLESLVADETPGGGEAAASAVGRYIPAAQADGPRRAGVVTLGFVGHPNVGKTSLLNAIVGRKVASVSRTPGHTKHLQTWELTPTVTICDSPGLVFPVAGALVLGRDVSPRAVYECCGLFPIAQIREPFSAVRLLSHSLDLVQMYNLHPQATAMADEEGGQLSPLGFCLALAERKGYAIARGKGSLDPHRAGLEVLKDCVDGAVCLAFVPPEAADTAVQVQ